MPAALFLTLTFVAAVSAASPVDDVELVNAKGAKVTVSRLPKAKLKVFVAAGTGCPVMRKYVPTLNALRKKWKGKGVELYLLGEAKHDDNPSFQKEAREFGARAPAYFDPGQEFVKRIGLDVTSKVAVLDGATGEVLYKGAIDDQYGADGRRPKKPVAFLDLNLRALVDGKPLPHPETRAYGCAITLR